MLNEQRASRNNVVTHGWLQSRFNRKWFPDNFARTLVPGYFGSFGVMICDGYATG